MKKTETERNATLDRICVGQRAVIYGDAAQGRLSLLGFCDGEYIECVLAAPLGDPRAYLIRGAVIALRRSDAEKIEVRLC